MCLEPEKIMVQTPLYDFNDFEKSFFKNLKSIFSIFSYVLNNLKINFWYSVSIISNTQINNGSVYA